MPRIAVCLVGFVRTLSEPRVYNAIERALRPPDASVDFFGAVSLGANESDTAKGQWGTVRHSDLKAALAVLRPRAWEEHVPQAPKAACGLSCMRQYERLQRCVSMIAKQERLSGARYDWVVKARPDLTFGPRRQNFSAMRLRDNTVYKDTAAGDMVVYIPRKHAENLTSLMASRLLKQPGMCNGGLVAWIKCDGSGAGPGCKCNNFLTGAATALRLNKARHRNTPAIARTAAAEELIRAVRRETHGDPMRALHNKGQAEWARAHGGTGGGSGGGRVKA